jgi:DNA-binding transcriptional regulator YhcF (GntR family)
VIVDVDTSSPIPPFEQIRSQITALADAGAIPAGTRLPTIRQLASDLGIAPGTVARAYRELESGGVVTSRVRHGTTIAARPKPSLQDRSDRLSIAARAYALAIAALGIDRENAVSELDRHIHDLANTRNQDNNP